MYAELIKTRYLTLLHSRLQKLMQEFANLHVGRFRAPAYIRFGTGFLIEYEGVGADGFPRAEEKTGHAFFDFNKSKIL